MPITPAKLFVLIPSAVLLFAACAKAYAVHVGILANDPGVWFSAIQAALEGLFAILLLSDWKPMVFRKLALFLFCAFSALSFYQLIQGRDECGCFGLFKVHPGITLAIDGFVIAVLAFDLTRDAKFKGFLSPPATMASCAVCLLTLSGVAWPWQAHQVENGVVVLDDGTRLLTPSVWVGNQIPLPSLYTDSAGMSDGTVDLLFVQKTCSICSQYVPQFLDECKSSQRYLVSTSRKDEYKSFLDLPNLGILELPPDRKWFIEVPCLVRLNNGIVTEVVSSKHIKALIKESGL